MMDAADVVEVTAAMTVEQLRQFARKNQIVLGSAATRKADIINVINGALRDRRQTAAPVAPPVVAGRTEHSAPTRREPELVGVAHAESVPLPRAGPAAAVASPSRRPAVELAGAATALTVAHPEAVTMAPESRPRAARRPAPTATAAATATSAGGSAGALAVRSGKVFQRFEGMAVDEWRTVMKNLVRDSTLSTQTDRVERMLARQRRLDFFTGLPLDATAASARTTRSTTAVAAAAAAAGSERVRHEVEHTFECQMMGHALVQSELMRDVLRSVDRDARSWSRQPVVVRNRLETVRRAQNGDANLTLVTHLTNMKKGGAVTRFLNSCDRGEASHGLEDLLYNNFSADYDDSEARRFAQGVVREIRHVEPVLISALADPELDGLLYSQGVQDRAAVMRELASVADELAQLCDAMRL